jgi:hypothetical protein
MRIRKSITAMLLMPVLCAGMLLATTGAAGAAVASGNTAADVTAADAVNTFESLGTFRCMDDSDLGFRTFPCNGTPFQKWNVHVFGDGTRRLQNQATGRCVYDGHLGFSTQFCGSSENVSWGIIHHHEVRLTFVNQATGRCIDDSDDSGFRTTKCNGGIYQDWV